MTGPCEYCSAPVADAETFYRLCVAPCCQACVKHAKARAIAWAAFSVAVLAFGVGAFLALK